MFKIIKKLLLILILFIISFISISCGNRDNIKPDAVSFRYLTRIDITDLKTAEIYELENKENVYYVYEPLSKPKYDNWIINYIYTYTYLVDDESFPDNLYDPFYDTIITSLNSFEEKFNLTFNLNKDGFKEEREISITDIKENEEFYLIDLYIPYKIIYYENNIKKNYVLMIPVYTFLASKLDENLSFNNETFDYTSFINRSNVLKK